MSTPTETTPPALTYPITITRAQLVARGACSDGLDDFRAVAKRGRLTIPDAAAHIALATRGGRWMEWHNWAVIAGLVPPITATAGYLGTATAGVSGTATAGDLGTATAGYRGTATAGYLGTATAGYLGTATAGDLGTATAGVSGTATAGVSGTATAGVSGTATAGVSGTISVEWWDGQQQRYRHAVAEIDGVTYRPGVPYRVVDGVLVEASPEYVAELARERAR